MMPWNPPISTVTDTATMPYQPNQGLTLWYSCLLGKHSPHPPQPSEPYLNTHPFPSCDEGKRLWAEPYRAAPRKVVYLAAPGMSQGSESQAEGSLLSHTCRPGGPPGSLWPS